MRKPGLLLHKEMKNNPGNYKRYKSFDDMAYEVLADA